MGAPLGNKYWQFRDKHGRDKKYIPEELWKEAIKYFEWVENNPLWESVVIQRGIKVQTVDGEKTVYSTTMPKMRAMTIKAFCIYADISHATWEHYKKDKDFITIITRIEDIIYSQKFEGASAQLLNPNIIARELGLIDKTETNVNGFNLTIKTKSKKEKDILDNIG